MKHNSVTVGSYVYDEPTAGDARLIAFGDVSPLVYSEVMSEIGRIVGVSTEGEEAS